MPLLFTRICDLLSALEDISTRDPPLLQARLRQKTNETIKSWFVAHHVSINSPDVDAVALLSTLFPSKRIDRVYNIQPPRLARLLRRWLRLGHSRWPLLDRWQQPGRGDLGDCVERVLRQSEFPLPHNKDRVTIEQIDEALAAVAARCRFSAPKARQQAENEPQALQALECIYQRLQSREAKWFTRIILKDFSTFGLPETLVYRSIDCRLPVAMRMYHDFESAISELRILPSSQLANAEHGALAQRYVNDAHLLSPRIGVKIGPPQWLKAKGGVSHAVNVIDRRIMSVERKHDGEYCQIHVDLSNGEDWIQIFSKSGKDSTEDRRAVHQAIVDGLRIGQADCKFQEKCILEGELVVWDERTKDIAEFHKIRKHVSRSGSFLGTTLDSQPHPWEHLMIMFYDVMLIDDDLILHRAYKYRRRVLEKLVRKLEGRTECTWRTRVNFDKPDGTERLQKSFALALARRWEGFVLKPHDEPYFDLSRPTRGRFPSRWIKLKKDCIRGLGDTADFAVVGAGYDVTKLTKHNIPNLRWTNFYIGCLRNKRGVLEYGEKPHFLVFDEISDCIKKEDLKTLHEQGYLRAMEPEDQEAKDLFDIEYASGLPRMKNVFRKPFVFDVAGSGFDKSSDRDIFTLRFPRVMRVHWDRSWKDTVTLDELQEMAVEARRTPSDGALMDEVHAWVGKLNAVDTKPARQLESWDHSDNEDEIVGLTADEMTRKTKPKASNRRNSTPNRPMIRMDTPEMQESERRLDSVIERDTSKDFRATLAIDGSLRTPPASSLLSSDSNSTRRQSTQRGFSGQPQNIANKRSAHAAERPELSTRAPKRSRSKINSVATQSSVQNSRSSLRAREGIPLHEIPITAATLNSSSSHSLQRQRGETSTDFKLVRKVGVGSEAHVRHIQQKPRTIMEPTSPARETTVSQSTSHSTTTTTSQQTAVYNELAAQVQSTAQHINRPAPVPILAPLTTANQISRTQLPDLQESKIILSPLLIEGTEIKEPVKDQLATLGALPCSFRQALEDPKSDHVLRATPKDTKQLILLVRSDMPNNLRYCMSSICKSVSLWHPMPLYVWERRILGYLVKGMEQLDEEEKRKADRSLLAEMVWNAEWEEEGIEGKGCIEVRWGDGPVSHIAAGVLDGLIERDSDGRIR